MLSRSLQYFHTVRYLRPVQVFGRLWFRLYSPAVSDRIALPLRTAVSPWLLGPPKQPSMLAADRFVFLHEEGSLSGPESWNDPARDKLWLYNLHYFDDLNADGAAERSAWHRALIQRWIAENPPGVGNGWEPYTLSLRIVNWVKWALQGHAMEPAWRDSLTTQVAFLRKRLEYGLLGNHLFTNAKALVFAGLYFSGDEADEWLSKGLSILRRQLPEQVLADGGHFERSAMYHAIVLEDLLDLGNVLGVYGNKASFQNLFPPSFRRTPESSLILAETIYKMQVWLRAMCHPDGGIGFFNDATQGIAPDLVTLERYADELGLRLPGSAGQALLEFPESGYIRVSQGAAFALLDVGEIGPDYLPGHAHADTLSFELSLFGLRCIVNSGISCYGNGGESRLYQRGTSAHSTVEIDGENSSEVWLGFRVARRARPFALRTETGDEAVSVRCSHDGYKRLKGKPVHTRQWQFEPGQMVVRDTIRGGFRRAVAYYHLHPQVQVQLDEGAAGGRIELAGGQVASWSVSGGQVSLEDSSYHPGFGITQASRVIKVVFEGPEAIFRLHWQEPIGPKGPHTVRARLRATGPHTVRARLRATGDERRTTDDGRRTMSDGRRATGDGRRATDDEREIKRSAPRGLLQ